MMILKVTKNKVLHSLQTVHFLKYSLRRHTGIPGLWTQVLDAGLWKLDSGPWTLDTRPWSLDAGLWTLDAGLWTLDSGPWTLDAGRWTLDVACYTFDAGLWALDNIFDCFRTKSEASFWFCLIRLLKILWVRISKDHMVTLAL